jgi:protein TonB
MKLSKQIFGILIIALTLNVSCTETAEVKKEEVSVKKLKQKKEKAQIEKALASNSKPSKNLIDKFPQPPPSVDDEYGIYFIPSHSVDDIAEIRDQQGDNYGVALSETPQEERYSNESPEPQRPQLEIFSDPEEPAEFPGGHEAMNKFLRNNLVYPQVAIEMNIQGKCYVRFIVNEDGSISNVRLMRGVTDCPECDKEAIRVIKSMPKWNPGKLNGKAVGSSINLPIIFKMI